MARNDPKKTPSRPMIERTEYSGGTTLYAFAPALYGTRPPGVTVVDPHTRLVLPPTTEIEQWLGTNRQTIAAHIAALVESESREFSAMCLQAVEEKSAKSARDIAVQAIQTNPKPCRDAAEIVTLGIDTTRISRYMQESATPLEVAYTLYLYAAHTCPDTASDRSCNRNTLRSRRLSPKPRSAISAVLPLPMPCMARESGWISSLGMMSCSRFPSRSSGIAGSGRSKAPSLGRSISPLWMTPNSKPG